MDLTSTTLANFGLSDLGPLVEEFLRSGKTWDEFQLGLYDPTTKQGKVVDTLYPELKLRRDQGHTPMSIAQVADYRDQAKAMYRNAGLPTGFYDEPSDFTALIAGDVSLQELNHRVQQGYVAASSAPTEVRQKLKDFYGVDEGSMAAYFLDPTKATSLLERQFATAQIGGRASQAGYGVDRSIAEDLAANGVSDAQAQQGFSQLAGSSELFNPLPGSGEDAISQQDQVDATFKGNAVAQRKVQQRARKRTAEFQGGGGFSSDKEGFGGLGSAR